MTEQELNDLSAYFDGYGSPYDDTILKLISEYKKQAERAEGLLKQTGHNFEVNRKLTNQLDIAREAINKAIAAFNQDEHQQGMSILLNTLEDEQ